MNANEITRMVLDNDYRRMYESLTKCKDCIYLMFSDCYGECKRGYLGGIVRPTDFCSRGERRNNTNER